MRKRNKKLKILSRPKSQREALLRTLAVSILLYGKIKTTETKAKQLRPFIEKVITRSKNDNLHNKRLLAKQLPPNIIKKLFSEVAPLYKDFNGGYTRIIKLGPRKSDGARMSIIELIK
jgi:large subunit ribosomal protein L17